VDSTTRCWTASSLTVIRGAMKLEDIYAVRCWSNRCA
jgi:hypothetical protein